MMVAKTTFRNLSTEKLTMRIILKIHHKDHVAEGYLLRPIVQVTVTGAGSEAEAAKIARSVAASSLTKA